MNNFGDTRSGGLAGPMGLFILVLLLIATFLLIRNMNARIRRLPDHFPDPPARPGAGAVGDAPPSESSDPDPDPGSSRDSGSADPDGRDPG